MIFYITVLRALAAIIITNAHYVGVYPLEILSNGGMLGDVMFFAVSGFSLVYIKQNFLEWYKKRIIRIYPTVWIITLVYILFGFYSFEEWTILEYLFYPTYYHFVASIIVLYIFFYFVMKYKKLFNNILIVMLVIFIIQLFVYLFFYDKTTYRIDVVREPMVRFIFFQSMLLGAYFRINNKRFSNKNYIRNWVGLAFFFFTYFISKLAFVKYDDISSFQILNQVILFALLYFIIRCFAGIDLKLENLPQKVKGYINFISIITLEIYVVQYEIIPIFNSLIFPLNWVVITVIIIMSAYVLHKISKKIVLKLEEVFLNQKLEKLKV